jgi:HEAT repeat protein
VRGVALLSCLLVGAACKAQAPVSPAEVKISPPDWPSVVARAQDDDYASLLSSLVWMVSHSGSEDASRALAKTMDPLLEALEKNQPSLLDPLGGLVGIEKQLLDLVGSQDDITKGAAAVMLGIIGDRGVIPAIRAVQDAKAEERDAHAILPPVAKGLAATALGMLGDSESIPRLVQLFAHGKHFERMGAARGLGFLKARDQERVLLASLKASERDAERTAILAALVRMDATDCAEEIAALCEHEGAFCGMETQEAQLGALVALHATKQARHIAKLLAAPYVKRSAAKSLALLGAGEYAKDIASLLGDSESLVQQDASIALGILGDVTFAEPISRLLSAKDESVRYYAAFALVLMNDRVHAAKAIEIIDAYQAKGYHFHEGDVPVRHKDFEAIKARFERQLAALRH